MHLQMCSEKLLKGFAVRTLTFVRGHNAVHNHFANLKAIVVGNAKMRRHLMGRPASRAEVIRLLDGLELTMKHLEELNPTVARAIARVAGFSDGPNCEYPWETSPTSTTFSPVRHRFGSKVGRAARLKVYKLLDNILKFEKV